MARKQKSMQVVQGNTLLEGAYKVGMDEMRLLHLALTHVETKDVFKPTPYIITTKAFSEIFDIPINSAYKRLKAAVNTLLVSPIRLYEPQANGKVRETAFPWFSKISYLVEESAEVEIVFNEHVRPYLYELQQNFTKIPFQNIAKLDQPFAIRLYSWLSRYRLLDNYKSSTGCRVMLELDWMKERSGSTAGYDLYADYRRWVISPAIEHINANTDITVTFEPVRKGRKITALEFFFIEQKVEDKPLTVLRPRLLRRPSAVKGSDLEGKWARDNIKLLLDYRDQIKPLGKKLTLNDMRRLIEYYTVIGDSFAAEAVKKSIEKRKVKSPNRGALNAMSSKPTADVYTING